MNIFFNQNESISCIVCMLEYELLCAFCVYGNSSNLRESTSIKLQWDSKFSPANLAVNWSRSIIPRSQYKSAWRLIGNEHNDRYSHCLTSAICIMLFDSNLLKKYAHICSSYDVFCQSNRIIRPLLCKSNRHSYSQYCSHFYSKVNTLQIQMPNM